jgi:hypothetical protein
MKKIITWLAAALLFWKGPVFSQPGANCFNTVFSNSAGTLDLENAYLMSYLSTMVYPDYIRFLEPSPAPGPESNYVKYFQHRNDTFLKKYANKLAYLFYDPAATNTLTTISPVSSNLSTINTDLITSRLTVPKVEPNVVHIKGVTFDFQYRCSPDGYDPEAVIISTSSTIYVVFRGTDRVSCNEETSTKGKIGYVAGEWINTNFKFLKRAWPNFNGTVHRGFIESLTYNGFADSVASRIKNKYGGLNKKIWITGHSLGGGHAQLFALYAKINWGLTAQGVYVYASPHPGDAAFAAQLNSAIGKSRIQRFEFLDDPIPTLAPQMIPFSYGRAGVRNWFNDINKMESGKEQIPVWDDGKLACAMANLALTSTINLEILYGCGGVFCYHHPTWLLKGLRNKIPTSVHLSLPADVPLPKTNEGTCTDFQINKGKNNDPLINLVDWAREGIKTAVETTAEVVDNITWQARNFLDNFTGAAISEGSYRITTMKPNADSKTKLTWLEENRSDADPGSTLRTWIVGDNDANNTFKIEKVLPVGYRIKMSSGKDEKDFLGNPTGRKIEYYMESPARDNDGQLITDNGCDANMQSLNHLWLGQVWLFYKVKDPNYYIIINAVSGKVLDASDNCGTSGGSCKVKTWEAISNNQSQVWKLTKQ